MNENVLILFIYLGVIRDLPNWKQLKDDSSQSIAESSWANREANMLRNKLGNHNIQV